MQRASAILEAFVVSVSITSSFSGDATLPMCWGSIPETISIGQGRIKGFVNESQLPWRPRSSLQVQQSGQFQSSEGFIMTTERQRSRADERGSQHIYETPAETWSDREQKKLIGRPLSAFDLEDSPWIDKLYH